MLEIDQVLHNRYRIVRQIGHGGMGAVYEAQDTKRFGKSVALKEILVNLERIPNVKQREQVQRAFKREAEILTHIDYEAFPEVIEYFSEEDRQFLVMKLIGGKNLEKLLKEQKSFFPLDHVLDWTKQLLEALDYLHTLQPHPIYHRDIKPQNLKLTERGKIKLLDFGIAKAADLSGTSTNSTFIGITYSFSPLEQCLRIPNQDYFEAISQGHLEKILHTQQQPIDARCDIYSLGATAYNLLTNQLPPHALERALEIWGGKPDPLTPPNNINQQVPVHVSNIILKAMALEREDRFESAKEMVVALNKIISEDYGRKTQPQFVTDELPNNKNTSVTTELMPTLRTHSEAIEQKDSNKISTDSGSYATKIDNSSVRSVLFFENPKRMSKVVWFAPLAVIFLVSFVGLTFYFSLKTSPESVINGNNNVNTNLATKPPILASDIPESNISAETANTFTTPTPAPVKTPVYKTETSAKNNLPVKPEKTQTKSSSKPPAKKPKQSVEVSPP